VEQRNRRSLGGGDIRSLVMGVFDDMPRGYWWKLLPDEDEDMDLCIATGRQWDDLLPVLLEADLIRLPRSSCLSKYEIVRPGFDDIRNRFRAEDDRFELTYYRKRIGNHQRSLGSSYYACLGRPEYLNPQMQLADRAKCNTLELRMLNAEITRAINDLRHQLYSRDLQKHIQKTPEQEKTMSEEELISVLRQEVGSTIQRQLLSELDDVGDDDETMSTLTMSTTNDEMAVPEQATTLSLADVAAIDANRAQRALEVRDQQINFALAVDLNRRPRLSRSGEMTISVHDGKQARQEDRNRALQFALLWGYADPHLTSAEHRRIAMATCRLVAYDHGYSMPLSHNMLPAWEAKIRNVLDTGEESKMATSPKHAGSVSYVEKIEERYPGYVRELWRYAIRTLGAGATYNELAECINAKSAVPGEDCPELSLSRRQLRNWFRSQGGIERSSKERPLLTAEMKANRMDWIQRYGRRLTDTSANVAMLDEKWFYKRNRRRKLKELPANESENSEDCKLKRPKATSRRYPVKIMYMGVVARPRPEHNFDGKILLLRVSERRQLKQATANERFVDDALLNAMLKEGEWRKLYSDDMTISELRAVVCDTYQLEDAIADRLSFGYSTFIGASGNKTNKQLDDDVLLSDVQFRKTEANDVSTLAIEDVTMTVRR